MGKPRVLTLLAVLFISWLTCAPAHGEFLSTVETDIGANTFYDLGYTGTRTIIGNVEAGITWNGHDTLNDGRVTLISNSFAKSGLNFQDHATLVGGTMVCSALGADGPGVANGSQLWSAPIATSFGSGGSFNISGNSLLYPLMVIGKVGINSSGVVGGAGSKTVDVINSSWGATDNTGNTIINVIYDYLADKAGVTMVVSAGNAGQGPGTVSSPANGWNVIAVGATGDTGTSETVTSFSSGGVTGSFIGPGSRIKPDIVAPGLSISMPSFNTSNPAAFEQASGTSFAAPITAACASLVIDYGKATGRSTDPRVMKSILLNSATKLTGWTQQKGTDPTTGTVINFTPLDSTQGSGLVNLTSAFQQYSASTGAGAAAGAVGTTGWSLNSVNPAAPKDYFVSKKVPAGSTLTATLIWFMDRSVTGFNANSPNPFGSTTFSNDTFDDLDLYLYKANANGTTSGNAVAASISGWNPANPSAPATGLDSVEQLYLTLPTDGNYLVRVNWTQELFDNVNAANTTEFALTWALKALTPGDANGDGLVNGDDLALWQQNYDPLGLHADTFAMGDWNMDGRIDGSDLALWQQNFLAVLPAGLNAEQQLMASLGISGDGIQSNAVPEPATMGLVVMGVLGLAARRRR